MRLNDFHNVCYRQLVKEPPFKQRSELLHIEPPCSLLDAPGNCRDLLNPRPRFWTVLLADSLSWCQMPPCPWFTLSCAGTFLLSWLLLNTVQLLIFGSHVLLIKALPFDRDSLKHQRLPLGRVYLIEWSGRAGLREWVAAKGFKDYKGSGEWKEVLPSRTKGRNGVERGWTNWVLIIKWKSNEKKKSVTKSRVWETWVITTNRLSFLEISLERRKIEFVQRV